VKIPEDKLESFLTKNLLSIYTILGPESVRIEENLSKIYRKSRKENFTLKDTYIMDKKTEWDFLASSSDTIDLFGSKKIIEIKLIGHGPGVKGAKALKEYCLKPDLNILLIVTIEGLDRKSHSSAWIEELEKAGALIFINPLSLAALPAWIQEKGQINGISILKEARLLLAERTEGNLMATMQEINKLTLIYPKQTIDLQKMEKTISNLTKFSIFDFSNAFIAGKTKRAIRILESLKAEGTPETLVLWALSRELANLFKVSQTGTTKGIRGPKHYLDALERSAEKIPRMRILEAFKKIAQIDSSIKGFVSKNAWLGIRELTLTF